MATSAALLLEKVQTPERWQPHGQCVSKYPVKFSASHRPNHTDDEEGMSATRVTGINPEHRSINKRNALKLVSSCLQSTLANASAPIKRIARIADVDRKTAAAWYNGHSAPGLHHLLNLMVEIPELAGEIRRVTTAEIELHEDLERDITALVRKAMAR